MSKLLGGPFSRASGKAAGLVFSTARTGLKKQQTIREYVIPANPRTNSQVSQRNRMAYASQIVQAIGQPIYRFDFNRAVKQLPGYPSLMNLFIMPMERDTGIIGQPRDVSLGLRHFPASFQASADEDAIDVVWSEEEGFIGDAEDQAVIIAVAVAPDTDSTKRTVIVNTSASRADGGVVLSDPALAGVQSGEFVLGLYFRSDEEGVPDRDRRSMVQWVTP